MCSRVAVLCGVVAALLLWPAPERTYGNDSAASTAVGGLKLTREPRVSMQKERLTISDKRVTVQYEFLNESDADLTTEVAFPIPEYRFEIDDPGGPRSFDDFKLWIEGEPYPYKIDVKATVKGVDRSDLLRSADVDIASFGRFDWNEMKSPEISRLTARQRSQFVSVGLIDSDDQFPQWSVQKTYHWTQTFPAKKILHVAHQYKPVIGFMPVSSGDLDFKTRREREAKAVAAQRRDPSGPDHWYTGVAKDIDQACIEPSLYERVDAEARAKNKGADVVAEGTAYIEMLWVDYVLTTANSWRTPIRDFELVVERPAPANDRHWYVSFCWDGHIEREGLNRFVVRAKDFVPKRELRVAFIGP